MTSFVPTVLGKFGYGLAKSGIDIEIRRKCRRELTVSPCVIPGFGPIRPNKYPVYRESRLRLFLPRHYGLKIFGNPGEVRIGPGPKANRLHFVGSLRPIQKKATDAFMATIGPSPEKSTPSVLFPHGGILALDVGLGKTVCALNLAARVGRKTLVVVHKEFLMHQWHERIQQFLPGARVGLIQQKKVDVVGKDIVIAMLQSLSVREYEQDVLSSFGMVIIDECHHCSSEQFSRALPKLAGARVTLGLSATPKRKDGLTKVFKWYLGEILFKASRPHTPGINKRAWSVRIDAIAAGYGNVTLTRTGNVNTAAMVNNIAENNSRTHLIAELALAVTRTSTMRQVIVLSGRRRHLDDIHKALEASASEEGDDLSIGYYVGGMNQTHLKQSEGCKIVLATYSMAAEGLDIKTLNTLIFATPMSDVTQAVGRILRKEDAKCPPWVIDLVDNFSVFKRQAMKRRRIITKQGFEVTNIDLGSKAKWNKHDVAKILQTVSPLKKRKTKKVSSVTIDALFGSDD